MDNASFRHSIQLARPSPTSAGDFGTETIPFFTSTTGTSNSGSKAILTVKNIGDHFPLGLRYPVLAINAIK